MRGLSSQLLTTAYLLDEWDHCLGMSWQFHSLNGRDDQGMSTLDVNDATAGGRIIKLSQKLDCINIGKNKI